MSAVLLGGLRARFGHNINFKDFIVGRRDKSENFRSCMCGHRIKELCTIIHRENGAECVVGNECIEHFGSNPICEECEIYETTSNTAKLCSHCKNKKTRPTHEVRLKKHKGKSYKEAWKDDPRWCEWVRDKMDPHFDPHFVAFLQRIKDDNVIYGVYIQS